MHTFSLRSLALAASAIIFASTASALQATGDLAAPTANLQARRQAMSSKETIRMRIRSVKRKDPSGSLQDVLDTLLAQTGPISNNIQSIAKAAPRTPKAETAKSMNVQYSSLETGLNVALEAITHLLAQVKGDVNLLDLAGTLTAILGDLIPALAAVEAGLSNDPALATLASLLNGPLVSLLVGVNSLTTGLLPVVNALLAGLGLAPLLLSLDTTIDGLLTGLGL